MTYSPKVLLFDIECSPIVGATWRIWNTNVPYVFEDWDMLSFAWAWLDDLDNIEVRALPDYTGRTATKKLARDLHGLFDEADVVIAHNGDKFDIRKANTTFILSGLPAPSPFHTVDTLKVARRRFAFTSNRLDDLAGHLGVGSKVEHEGMKLWVKCMDNQPEAWAKMREYNAHDVTLLAGVYQAFLDGGWIDNHPNMAAISGRFDACPKCGVSGKMRREGKRLRSTYMAQEWRCGGCNSYSTERLSIPESAPMFK